MGSRGPIAKQEGRQRPQAPTADASPARLLEDHHLEPSPRWLGPTRQAYIAYVDSPVANVLDPIDVETVRRLFTYYDLWARLQSRWYGELEQYLDAPGEIVGYTEDGLEIRRRDPLLGQGSQGQQVVSPLLASMRQLEQSIRQLEDRLGVTPQARARLGIDLSEAAVAAEKAHRMTRKDRGEAVEG